MPPYGMALLLPPGTDTDKIKKPTWYLCVRCDVVGEAETCWSCGQDDELSFDWAHRWPKVGGSTGHQVFEYAKDHPDGQFFKLS